MANIAIYSPLIVLQNRVDVFFKEKKVQLRKNKYSFITLCSINRKH